MLQLPVFYMCVLQRSQLICIRRQYYGSKLSTLASRVLVSGYTWIRATIKSADHQGYFFIILEVFINNYSNLNLAVYYSWLLDIEMAQKVINYHWLLFYPCIYVYSIFDAYYDCCKLSNKNISKWMGIPYIITYIFREVRSHFFACARVNRGVRNRVRVDILL